MAVINDGEPGAFFICTETSPRCYIIQRVNVTSVDRVLDDLTASAGEFDTPPTPVLPWWFTPECENQLMMASGSAVPDTQQYPMCTALPAPASSIPVVVPVARAYVKPQTPEEIKEQLKAQLDYYFSRENLMTDRYLRSQMDNDQYVPIRIIAGFPKVKRITNDITLVVQVLRESSQVQVDDRGERVRAVSKRCTIILREIPKSTDEKEVASMFIGGPPYLSLSYGLNNSWYVTFETEEVTQRAFLHLQNLGRTFNNKPICARIKTGGAPRSEKIITEVPERSLSAVPSDTPTDPGSTNAASTMAASPSSSENFDLGQILAIYGYVPRATFKPGAAIIHMASTLNTLNVRNIENRMHGTAANDGNADGVVHTGCYRGSGSRGRITFSHNHRTYGGHRDYNNGIYNGNSRRNVTSYQDVHRDSNRLHADAVHRTRARLSRPAYINNNMNGSKISVDVHKNHQNDFRQHATFEREFVGTRNTQLKQQQQRSKREFIRVGSNSSSGKCATVCDGHTSNSENLRRVSPNERIAGCVNVASDDSSKSETSWKRTDNGFDYNFEEGAFPSLSDQISKVEVEEQEKVIEKPTFSSVAAGRKMGKNEPKEMRSYAQTLKQNNGVLHVP